MHVSEMLLRAGSQDIGTPEQVTPGGVVWREVFKGDGGKVAIDNSDGVGEDDESLRYSYSTKLSGFRRVSYDSDNVETGSTDIACLPSGRPSVAEWVRTLSE